MRSGFDKDTGLYRDITTGRLYQKDNKCALCGATWKPLFVHHFLDQSKCERDKKSIAKGKVIKPNMWTQEFINEHQKLYTVCKECHAKIESKSREPINNRIPRDYVYRNEEKKVKPATPPKAFVWKKGNSRF